ncbi:MAG TPA: alpha/beta hydrolase [Mycobacteriales bacterium]|nr:alpha/beta hydrolase [Mycobacteriales bacterium]
MQAQLVERQVRVSDDPVVELFIAETDGDPDRTLLVVHGGPDWDQMYLREPLVHLGSNHRVLWVDLRGCGRSTRGLPGPAHTPAAAVRDLVELIRQLGVASVDVLGFSYGGQLVQRLVVAAPNQVQSAIVASSSILRVPPDAFVGWRERDDRVAAQAPVAGYDDDSYDDERTRLDAVNSAVANIWQLERLPEYLARLDLVHFSSDWSRAWPDHSLMPASRPDNVVEELRELGTPLLLLHGQQDMTFPVELVAQTLPLLPNARGVVLPQAGHMAHIDQPQAWLDAVRAFLDEVAPTVT